MADSNTISHLARSTQNFTKGLLGQNNLQNISCPGFYKNLQSLKKHTDKFKHALLNSRMEEKGFITTCVCVCVFVNTLISGTIDVDSDGLKSDILITLEIEGKLFLIYQKFDKHTQANEPNKSPSAISIPEYK